MSSIQGNSSPGPRPQSYPKIPEATFASRSRQVQAYEQLNAGLTIQTREGDVVTLSSSSHAGFSASSYTSQGVLESDSGKASVNRHSREIVLTTGESFSFSVTGDLNEQELEDIENIIRGIDAIISEVAEGDMDDAVETALSMGTYESISRYAADVRYARTYSMTQGTSSPGIGGGMEDGRSGTGGRPVGIAGVFEKMAGLLEDQEEKLLEKASQPLDSLFRHHIRNREENQEGRFSVTAVLERMRERLEQMISEMINGGFDRTLDKSL